jgi:hypothetical protein
MFKHPHHAALALFVMLAVAFAIPSVSSALKSTSLTVGATGENVKLLQTSLIQKGYLSGSATGTYDTSTAAAVKEFQTEQGLTADGIAGTVTLNKVGVPVPVVATVPTAVKVVAGTPPTPYVPVPEVALPAEEYETEGCEPLLAVKRSSDSPKDDLLLEASDDQYVFTFYIKTGSCEVWIEHMDIAVQTMGEETVLWDGLQIEDSSELEVIGELGAGAVAATEDSLAASVAVYETEDYVALGDYNIPPYTEKKISVLINGLDVVEEDLINTIVAGVYGFDGYYLAPDGSDHAFDFGTGGMWGHVLDVRNP